MRPNVFSSQDGTRSPGAHTLQLEQPRSKPLQHKNRRGCLVRMRFCLVRTTVATRTVSLQAQEEPIKSDRSSCQLSQWTSRTTTRNRVLLLPHHPLPQQPTQPQKKKAVIFHPPDIPLSCGIDDDESGNVHHQYLLSHYYSFNCSCPETSRSPSRCLAPQCQFRRNLVAQLRQHCRTASVLDLDHYILCAAYRTQQQHQQHNHDNECRRSCLGHYGSLATHTV